VIRPRAYGDGRINVHKSTVPVIDDARTSRASGDRTLTVSGVRARALHHLRQECRWRAGSPPREGACHGRAPGHDQVRTRGLSVQREARHEVLQRLLRPRRDNDGIALQLSARGVQIVR
jgi:hypothetical protein